MFTQEVADKILAGLAECRSLKSVCRDEGMPSASTVLAWLDDPRYEAFADQYTLVRARSYRLMADEILEISDEPSGGEFDAVSRAKLRVDSRKWMLSKMLPKVYGDKLDLNHSGRIATSREMSEEELASIASGSGG